MDDETERATCKGEPVLFAGGQPHFPAPSPRLRRGGVAPWRIWNVNAGVSAKRPCFIRGVIQWASHRLAPTLYGGKRATQRVAPTVYDELAHRRIILPEPRRCRAWVYSRAYNGVSQANSFAFEEGNVFCPLPFTPHVATIGAPAKAKRATAWTASTSPPSIP